ncbi:MAG: TraR/DksA C4-type zinc finger protein [Deltaproteobacteria bacterium]|nr:TraR/DksA C4-type zinc finger protein [Deltaproteobacteria bacterium]
MNYSDIIKFHGHSCPGLAIGYRMANTAMDELRTMRSADEEIVAVVENNACGVDALQCVTGCTFGKGNLMFRDYGKHVYTLYSRASGKGVRVVFHGRGIPAELRSNRQALIKLILEMPADEILSVSEVVINEPARAEIHKSAFCSICGESVMSTRLRYLDGNPVCIPCAEGENVV